jgi:hypothetical protein
VTSAPGSRTEEREIGYVDGEIFREGAGVEAGSVTERAVDVLRRDPDAHRIGLQRGGVHRSSLGAAIWQALTRK